MAKTNRIAPWHIKRVFAKGRQFRGLFFNLKAFKRAAAGPDDGARIVIVISKKVFAKAHDRNLCRRRVSSAFKEATGPFKNWDLVVFPNKSAITADFEKLKEDARGCLEKLQFTR